MRLTAATVAASALISPFCVAAAISQALYCQRGVSVIRASLCKNASGLRVACKDKFLTIIAPTSAFAPNRLSGRGEKTTSLPDFRRQDVHESRRFVAMLFSLPDHPTLYAALLQRSHDYEGRAYVGVTSTGIFCRLTCGARKPKPENCRFYGCVADCLAAGFRACMRCRPLGRLDQTDPAITRLLAQLEVQPMRRWSEADLVQMGLDPSTVRRGFKRHFGATFLQLARQRRVQMGLRALSTGDKVIDAQLTAGFSSPSAFRLAFAQLMGQAPGSLKRDAVLKAGCIDTPLGPMLAVADAKVLHLLEFIDRRALRGELARLRSRTGAEVGMGHSEPMAQVKAELVEYFDGKRAQFEVALAEHGSSFERAVWADLRAIPAGQTRSYGAIAAAMGRPGAARAVARANGANQLALVIPCHRVIGSDGALTGYGGGLWRKQRLLEMERKYL